MRMGHLVGGIDRVELVVMRVRGSTLEWSFMIRVEGW